MNQLATSRRDFARNIFFLGAAAYAAPIAGPALAQSGGPVDAAVKAAYDQFKGLNEGKNADYIPALAKVPSNYFGIALATPQGKLYTAGDIEPKFSIQSISKVFTMALVFQQSGEKTVEDASIGLPAARLAPPP